MSAMLVWIAGVVFGLAQWCGGRWIAGTGSAAAAFGLMAGSVGLVLAAMAIGKWPL